MRRSMGLDGFSLVETLLCLGITAIAGLAILNLQTQGLKTNKDIETGAVANDFGNEVRNLLARGQTCAMNFTLPGNVSSSHGELLFDSADATASLAVKKLVYANDLQTVKAAVGQRLRADNQATIDSITIKNLLAMSADKDSFKGDLEIAYVKGEAGIGGQHKVIRIPIFLRTEVVSSSVVKITGCATSATEQTNPILHCGSIGKIYLPTGFSGNSADVDGCVSPVAFVGPQGPAGASGSAGSAGTPGPSPASVSGPKSGDILGGGSCVPYHSGPCAGHCGGGSTGCAPTWNYTGAGRPGGCSQGNMQSTGAVAAGITGFLCVQP